MQRLAILGLLMLPAQADPEGAQFFDQKVLPLFQARCFKCHGPEAPKPKGGLRLDTREAALKGGDTGPALVPGKPHESLLLKAVGADDPDVRMPPKEKLPDGEVALLKAWIEKGAPWGSGKPAGKPEKKITPEDRAWWSFQPVREPAVPAGPGSEIDRFIRARLRAEGLTPAPEADRRTLLRRVAYDLTGLPPAPEDPFERDGDYEALVERLLASPRYGERWARHWLDLARYAESEGYKQDAYRPNAWPYRDWVVRAFNDDKPYDRFVREQLAGDELAPDDPDVVVATGFLRLGIYEYNQRNAPGQWRDLLNEVTDVVGDAFLGLGMACARCHDHKFDPILQRDYFGLQSFLAGIYWRDGVPLAPAPERSAHASKVRPFDEKTAALREELAAIEKPFLENAHKAILGKFLPELQEVYRKSAADRTPYEQQIADLIQRQVIAEGGTIDGKIKGATREKWSELKRKIAELERDRPAPLPAGDLVSEVGPAAPNARIPGGREVAPAFLAVLGGEAPKIEALPASSGRRSALADWLTRRDHPLTARVMVNRIWQHHFGRGLVATSSDWGRLGERPSHPELLDWLAATFMKDGWSVKALHRRIVLSATYRQAAVHPAPEAGRLKDPDNRLLWKLTPRRLAAEQVRDAMLSVAGELDLAMGGPSIDPNLPRRTVYTKVLRNTRDPLLEAFDSPESFSSVPARNATTTATQALLMVNGRWPLERAQAFAKRLRGLAKSDEDLVRAAYRLAYGRPPTDAELARSVAFLGKGGPSGAPADLPLVQAMPDRGGQAARMRSASPEDRLRLADDPALPSGDFTVEAIVILDSLHEDAQVRVIASQWGGKETLPGWSFGVTSRQSKHGPQNLILQLVGEQGYEVVPSDLRIALHKTHYVAATVKIAETGQAGVTFYLQDLSDPEAQLRTANVRHKVTGGYRSKTALVLGGRDGPQGHGWDGLIDELRISRAALGKDQLLLLDGTPSAGAVAGHWTFEHDPGFFHEAEGRLKPLVRTAPAKAGATEAGLVDFCHVLLNSNEFLYVD
jgi:hypothetical protein